MHGMYEWNSLIYFAVNRYRKVVAEKKKQVKSHWALNKIHLFELAIYTWLSLILQSYVILLPTDNPQILLNS